MPLLLGWLLLLVCSPTSAFDRCPASKHEVTSLPGYGPPPSKWVSGFVDAELLPGMEAFGHMCFHYTFIESLSSPSTDPVLIWYQGGPGAPGLFGLFLEFGPLLINADSLRGSFKASGMPEPVQNPFSWARHANLLIMDNTPPIGFSYCSAVGPAATGTQCGAWTDTSTFAANHKALTIFFNSIMPDLRGRPVFLAGESYGGVYVPGIAEHLIDDPHGIYLAGFMVVSGCMGLDVLCFSMDNSSPQYPAVYAGPWYDLLFFHGHGQVSNELYARILATCSMKELKGETQPLSVACRGLIDEMFAALGGFWSYNILDDCDWSWLGVSPVPTKVKYPFHPNGYACSSPAHEIWLAKEEVRRALGVPLNSNYILVDNGAGFTYTADVKDVRPMWIKALKAGVRVVAMTGDLDTNVNMFALQDIFVDAWKQAGYKQTQAWRPWTLDGAKRMGGYTIEWANGNASFVTFRGAGHMIPEYKAEASSVMLERWMVGKHPLSYETKRITQLGPDQNMVMIM